MISDGYIMPCRHEGLKIFAGTSVRQYYNKRATV